MPASTKPWWTARTRSGCSRFQSSGACAGLEARARTGWCPWRRRRPGPAGGASRSVSGSAMVPGRRLFSSAPRPPRRRRGRLSATLVRPAARRRARRRCTIARRSASPAAGQARDLVERAHAAGAQPDGRIQPADADAGRGDVDHLRVLMAFDGGWSLAGSDRARAAGAQATRVARAASGRYRRWAGPASLQGQDRAAQRATSVRSSGSPSERRQPHLTMSPGRRLAYVLRSSRRSRRAGSSLLGNAVVRRPFGGIEATEVLRDALRAPPGRSDVLPWAPIRVRLTPKRRDVGVKQSAATEGGSRHARDQALAARRGDPAGWRRRPGRRSRELQDGPLLRCRLDRHHRDHRGRPRSCSRASATSRRPRSCRCRSPTRA